MRGPRDGYPLGMTSDLEATTDDLYNTVRDLWQQAQGGASGEVDSPAGFGQAVVSVPDADIVEATGLALEVVRDYLDHADGTQLVVARTGDTRLVQGLR